MNTANERHPISRLCLICAIMLFHGMSSMIGQDAMTGQTSLERLWERCRASNIDLKKLENNVAVYKAKKKYGRMEYAPSVVVSGSSGFSDSYEEYAGYPSKLSGSLVVSQPLPGNTIVNVESSYGLSRILTDSYLRTPSVSLTIVQGLRPYWLQGERCDPYKTMLGINLRQSEETKSQSEEELLAAITACYIQLRQHIRTIEYLDAIISYYGERVAAYEKMSLEGSVDAFSVWEEEETRWEYLESLKVARGDRDDQIRLLRGYCDMALPANTEDLESVYQSAGYDALPPIPFDVPSHDPFTAMLDLRYESARVQMIQTRQVQAPSLSLSGMLQSSDDISMVHDSWFVDSGEKKNWSWSITASVDVSALFSPGNKQNEALYVLTLDTLWNDRKALELQRKTAETYYADMINSLKIEQSYAEELLENCRKKLRDTSELFESGGCSRLELLMAEVNVVGKKTTAENIADLIWYYSWMNRRISANESMRD